jgi:hypothetical protein
MDGSANAEKACKSNVVLAVPRNEESLRQLGIVQSAFHLADADVDGPSGVWIRIRPPFAGCVIEVEEALQVVRILCPSGGQIRDLYPAVP